MRVIGTHDEYPRPLETLRTRNVQNRSRDFNLFFFCPRQSGELTHVSLWLQSDRIKVRFIGSLNTFVLAQEISRIYDI